jgi:hypothetical protein
MKTTGSSLCTVPILIKKYVPFIFNFGNSFCHQRSLISYMQVEKNLKNFSIQTEIYKIHSAWRSVNSNFVESQFWRWQKLFFRLAWKWQELLSQRPDNLGALSDKAEEPIRGRCYDHNFLRFSSIFGEKIGVFLKNQCYDQNFAYFSFVLDQKRQFFRWIFRRKYLKNHNIGPRSPVSACKIGVV